MVDAKTYAETLFKAKGIKITSAKLFEDFVKNNDITNAVKDIVNNQNRIMEKWQIKTRINDILSQQIILPNGIMNKEYCANFDVEKFQLEDLAEFSFLGLDELGLSYDENKRIIAGVLKKSGNLEFKLLFKTSLEDDTSTPNEKIIKLIVNPDPKTLWKDLPSDKNDPFWKEDNISKFEKLSDKYVLVSSKRGRSHQNVGTFREDDFSYGINERSGWSVVAVSDGAGSYSLSRKGSELACATVREYFESESVEGKLLELEGKLIEFNENKDEVLLEETKTYSKQILYKAVLNVHNKIKEHAHATFQSHPEFFVKSKGKTPMDYYHSTLIFALFKKFDFGYVVLTFGVGDCPIALMNKDKTEVKLLNWLDVGEFGGGTRFVTQPEIFHSKEHPMSSRFNFTITSDFSYLFLMSDGIYDPKFIVEANLEKQEKWLDFLADLEGENDDNNQVVLDPDNDNITAEISQWMDFWSPGNHDDRTLAIIF